MVTKHKRGNIMNLKKIVALFFAIAFVIAMPISSYAYTQDDEYLISPQYLIMDGIYCEIDASGQDVSGSCTVYVFDTCVVKIKITIQKAAAPNGTWSNYQVFSTVSCTSGSSRGVEKTAYSVPSGYYYRTKAYVEIYVDNELIEYDTVYSGYQKV